MPAKKEKLPKVEAPTEKQEEKKETKVEFKATGKFELAPVDGGFMVYGPKGQKISSVLTEEKAKDMVKKFNK